MPFALGLHLLEIDVVTNAPGQPQRISPQNPAPAQRFVELQLPPGGELGDLIWQDSDALNLCGGCSETEPGKQAGAPDEVSLPELQQHNAHQNKTQRNSERKTQAMRKVSGNRRGRKNSCGNEDRDQRGWKLHARRESRTKASI